MAGHIPSAHIVPECALKIVASIQVNRIRIIPRYQQLFDHSHGPCIAPYTFFATFTGDRFFVRLFESIANRTDECYIANRNANRYIIIKLPGMEIVYVNDGNGKEFIINLRNVRCGTG